MTDWEEKCKLERAARQGLDTQLAGEGPPCNARLGGGEGFASLSQQVSA